MQSIIKPLEQIRQIAPLVHNITNVVVTNFTANGLLALGASPIMAYAKQEVADIARICGSVVLNIGTLNETDIEAMIIAGKAANQHGIAVIFDPVGAGASAYRTSTSHKILQEVQVSIVRGNQGEIASLLGWEWQTKGVDAGEGSGSHAVQALAAEAARKWGTTVVVTGKEDFVSDGEIMYKVQGGDALLTKVTGTGCLLSSVIGAYAAVEPNRVTASLAALVAYSVAAELAAAQTASEGPGSFQIQFLNQLSQITAQDIEQYGRFELTAI